MGLGGHLMWSSVIRTLHEASGHKVIACYTPMLTDLARGWVHDAGRSLDADQVFRHNPRIEFPPVRAKRPAGAALDARFDALLWRSGLRRPFEAAVFRRARRFAQRTGVWHAHVDMQLHSYVARETPGRLEWKPGGHVIDIILASFGVKAIDHRTEMYFTDAERQAARATLRACGVGDRYIAIEPNSRGEWFSDLRVWPVDRWQQVVDRLRAAFKESWRIVQVGEAGRPVLNGVVDMTGKTSFREAVLTLSEARLFLGLEGGLMHAANAVGVPSVIVWGGTTEPGFAAYPERHAVICRHVECAPCGLRRDCPHEKRCLTSIDVDSVCDAASRLLTEPAPSCG